MTPIALPQLEKFIPLADTAQRLGMSMTKLHSLIQRGELKAAVLPNGELGINEQSLVDLDPKDQRPEYKKHVHLKGRLISLTDASRKYKVPIPTISRWVKRGCGLPESRMLVQELSLP